MPTLRERLIENLPITKEPLTIHLMDRADIDHLAKWPAYQFPYEPFNLPILNEDSHEKMDEYFIKRNSDKNRIYMVVDHVDCKVIGLFSLIDIDWTSAVVGNMAIRIRPDWCNRGVGTKVLLMLSDWGFSSGLKKIRLDVAGSNRRAIRCYEKAGYKIVGEFWRDDHYLLKYDLQKFEDASIPIKSHVRLDKKIPQLRFYWMEAVRNK